MYRSNSEAFASRAKHHERMRNIDLKTYWEDFREKFSARRAEGDIHPEFAWKIILASFLCALLFVIGGASVAYTWAMREDAAYPVVGKKDHGGISAEDFEGVLAVFEEKKKNHERLRNARPTAPAFFGENANATATTDADAPESAATSTTGQ